MKFLLDGNEVTPKNYEEIELIIDKTREGSASSMNLTHLIFVNEAKKYIDNWLATKGYFNGIPLDVVLDNGYTLNYYLDQTDEMKVQDHQIEIAVKKSNENLQFWEVVNATSFLSLGGVWAGQEIGWVVISTNEHIQLLSFGETFLSLAKQVIDMIYDFKNMQSAASGVGTWIYALILIAFLVVKFTSMLAQIITFMYDVKEYVSPTVNKLKVTDVRFLIERSISQLGYTLADNTFINEFNDIIYLGTINKGVNDVDSPLPTSLLTSLGLSPDPIGVYPVGYPIVWDLVEGSKYDYTIVGGFISWFLDNFNAKISIDKNRVVTLNRSDYVTGSVGNITTGLTIQNTRVSEYTPNTNEVWSRCLVRFPLDTTDEYTSFLFEKSVSEASVGFGFGFYAEYNLIKGIKDVNMVFGQGFTFSTTPKKFKVLLQKITGKLAGMFSPALGTWVGDLIYGTIPYEGILATSQNTFNRPKLLRSIGGLKVEPITAQEIFDNYHEVSFIKTNSFMIHSGELLECSDDLFISFDENDYVNVNGSKCETVRLAYSPFKHKASLIYKKPSNYANDLLLGKFV